MKSVRISDAQANLPELVESLDRGDIVITRDERPVARLTRVDARPSLRDLKPVSLGAPLRPLERDDDLLDELLRS
jgi:antitoxin (DNA-binding transcriptional repressor) of toxin-antitoxin stability system